MLPRMNIRVNIVSLYRFSILACGMMLCVASVARADKLSAEGYAADEARSQERAGPGGDAGAHARPARKDRFIGTYAEKCGADWNGAHDSVSPWPELRRLRTEHAAADNGRQQGAQSQQNALANNAPGDSPVTR
jgi:hypothetical protein